MTKPSEVVFLTTERSPIDTVAEAVLRDFKIRHVRAPGWSFDDTVLNGVAGTDAILVRLGVVTKQVMNAASNLKVIAVHGVGVDRVDLDEARKRGIVVTSTPLANVASVAEYAVGVMISLIRDIPACDRTIKEKRWRRAKYESKQILGKTVGIVGLGNIGSRVAKRLSCFEANIIAYDPYVPAERFEELGVKPVSLHVLMSEADIVTIHVPLTKLTHHMIKEKELGMMRPEAYIINTSRGAVIDEKALITALQDNMISGAALDVFEEEPLDPDNQLLSMQNVILTPHIAGMTAESDRRTAETAAKDILRVLNGEKALYEYRSELLPYPT